MKNSCLVGVILLGTLVICANNLSGLWTQQHELTEKVVECEVCDTLPRNTVQREQSTPSPVEADPSGQSHRLIMTGLEEVAPWRMFDSTEVQDDDYFSAYFRLLKRMDLSCSNVIRLGLVSDGGWDMCLVGPYIPRTDHCLVYSFGISEKWSFDDAITEMFHCKHRAFDPTSENQKEYNRSQYITFYPIGLYGQDGTKVIDTVTRPVNTLSTLLRRFGEQDALIDYLKIDVESSEWETLETAIEDGSLANVKQLAMEFHSYLYDGKYERYVQIASKLETIGFRKWQNHWNMRCNSTLPMDKQGIVPHVSRCSEVYYLNVNFLD